MYTAYFDESGHVDEKFIAIAGFVATEERWRTFNERWRTVLAAHGARFLHTTDLMNYKREFKGWTRERENGLMADLMEVIHGTGRIAAVGAVMALEDFRSLAPNQQVRLRDPFFVLFQEVIHGAALEAYFDSPNIKVNMVYSQTDEFAGTARQLFALMASRQPRIGTLEFSDMRETPGLQAADLLAYELWRYFKNQRANPEIRMRWALRRVLWQQRVLNIHLVKTVPRWYLRLQLSPFYQPVMTAVAIAVAIPAYFKMTWFSKANRAPVLPAEDEAAIEALEAEERRRGFVSGA